MATDQDIKDAYARLGNMAAAGRLLGISRQRVHQIIRGIKSTKGTEYQRTYRAKHPETYRAYHRNYYYTHKPREMEMRDYCTQNDGDCYTCALVNYGRDCHNNQVPKPMKRTELRLPEDLYEDLRERAHKARTSLNSLIVLMLTIQTQTQQGEMPKGKI